MILRRAEDSDNGLLFAWRNDPETFKFFRNARPISITEHAFWFSAHIDHPEHEIWIAVYPTHPFKEMTPVGVVHLDAREKEAWEVSITVAPQWRGGGLGYQMLSMACDMKRGPLLADIHKDNAASLAIFKKCGFMRISNGDGWADFILHRRDRETV